MISTEKGRAHFHLPGLFQFFDFYKVFLPLYYERREWFYDWCDIASIYGAPENCIWGGGRTAFGNASADEVLSLLEKYGISGRLTFSNSLLREEHLLDRKCNLLCKKFSGRERVTTVENGKIDGRKAGFNKESSKGETVRNGVIVHSELLAEYLKKNYPKLYLVSSTTKVITDFSLLEKELEQPEFSFVVPDFRLNRDFENFGGMSQSIKDKVEFLCNECCWTKCSDRKACYENVSRKNLGESCSDHVCRAPDGNNGYRFSKAMENPMFISIGDIQKLYLPKGFSNFKIEGRGLGSAVLLEFLLYYLTKPEFFLKVREEIYLDSMLDLF